MPLMFENEFEYCFEELPIDYDQLLYRVDYTAMDATLSGANSAVNDETNPRAKFLCSFGGCVLPRPQDGKLRYVGGETRIVIVPRSIGYEELMARMRELCEGASILKYQQPDEDLDALVSVVNDDDVVNMMEEYDKLVSGDGLTRLRIFLFSHLDQDTSPRYMDADERDPERRYVDALNSLNESPEYRRQNLGDSHMLDQFFNSMNLDGSVHNHRNYEMAMPPYNAAQLASSGMVSSVPQLFTEEGSWSPAGYSPRYAGPHDMRTHAELVSPSSGIYHMPYQEMTDRMADEFNHQQVNSQIPFDHRQQYCDQVAWLPTGSVPVERGGFPGNLFNGSNAVDCPSVCPNCKTSFQRIPSSSDFHRKPEEPVLVELPAMGNGFTKVANPCVEGLPRTLSGGGMVGDQCMAYGPSTKLPVEPHHIPAGVDALHGQALPNNVHLHNPFEEQGVQAANLPYMQGTDILHQVSHSKASVSPSRRDGLGPLHVLPHEPPIFQPRNSIPSLVPTPRGLVEGSPRILIGADQGPWVESPQIRLGGDGSILPEYTNGHLSMLSPQQPYQEIQQTFAQDPLGLAPNMVRIPPSMDSPMLPELSAVVLDANMLSSNAGGQGQLQRQDTCNVEVGLDETNVACVVHELTHLREAESSVVVIDARPNDRKEEENSAKESLKSGIPKVETVKSSSATNGDLISWSEQISSALGVKLEGVEEFKGGAQGDGDSVISCNASGIVANADVTEPLDVKNHSEGGTENACLEVSKIERTKDEEEAVAKGLQTIKNDDLEEVRELGSGTYGAVYHGKWKGSDVAIKRIKASCFSGRPSERERLIADFWKEALRLSSLHHPNVISFYGVVRDGPEGSLATVTEFMVNGSLKQYLRKKDRTIDRRKRLIIAMDAAFGMEYLHERNIVHFDLKCENLLVNMRDPHRPVCKIGDLGLSKVKQHTLVSGGVRGTLPWMAPELLSGKNHMVTEKIDVYSFGIVMWELLTGEEPYSDMHCASLIGGIVNDTLRPQIPTWCDPEWKSLMQSCWASDPAERPSFSEISQKLRSMAAAMNVK